MRYTDVQGKPAIFLTVNDSEVMLRFAEEYTPNIRNDIADILTAAYEARINALFSKATTLLEQL
jgi:hypothetical protein